MKRIKEISAITLSIVILIILPYIWKFVTWLILIDNANTGLNLLTENVVKMVVSFLVGLLSFQYLKTNNKFITTVLSIIFGFLACIIVNALIQYWYLFILPIIIITVLLIKDFIVGK